MTLQGEFKHVTDIPSFQVRTKLEHDIDFACDRLVVQALVDGAPSGACSVINGLHDGMEVFGQLRAKLEREVIDTHLGLGFKNELIEAYWKIQKLSDYINRPRWWQLRRLYRLWRSSRSGLL